MNIEDFQLAMGERVKSFSEPVLDYLHSNGFNVTKGDVSNPVTKEEIACDFFAKPRVDFHLANATSRDLQRILEAPELAQYGFEKATDDESRIAYLFGSDPFSRGFVGILAVMKNLSVKPVGKAIK